MNKNIYNYLLCFAATCILLFSSCQDPWKEQSEIQTQSNNTVLEEIAAHPDLTTFYDLLKKSGVEKRLLESRSFTVWAPNNASLSNLNQAIVNDEALLKAFVENHISYQSYFTKEAGAEGIYSRSINGKKVLFTKTTYDESSISSADHYLKNGVLHIINGYAIPKQNAYEYLVSLDNKQARFIQSLDYIGLDISQAVLLYYDPITGDPVYQEGTTFPVSRNILFENVSNISSEDSLLTYIILDDNAFDFEINHLKDYNKTSSPELADTLSKWHAIKDLVVTGLHQGTALNDLVSTTGIRFAINQSDIVETKKLSNGIAYVVNKINYNLLANKVPTIIIEGAFPDSLRVPSTVNRKILKDFEGNIFTQLETPTITSSPSPLHYFRYKTTVHSTKYEVWARVRNTVLTVPFSMAVGLSPSKTNVSAIVPSPYFPVPVYNSDDPNTLKEIYAGTATITEYGNCYVYLFSSAGATSALPTALALNYLKLVPVN
jgi:uncharacterized surface protein with fasciclin (FAS1) repeats